MNQPTLQTSELIRALRDRLGLSQEKLAARLGVSFQTVNRWEKGRVTPSPLGLKAIEQQVRQMGDRGADLLEAYFRE